MKLIHLELETGLTDPDWDAMVVRLAATQGDGEKGNPRATDLMITSDDGELFDRGHARQLLSYLEQAWDDGVQDSIRTRIAGAHCLFAPDYSDEECGHQKVSRLTYTMGALRDHFPFLLMAGGFQLS